MAELILHHYPISPFAEKIRLVLAWKRLPWTSVIIPRVMPKPDLQALTGGYRRTPVLQVGADVYCDTALICDVLEHLAPTPTLYPNRHKGLARVLAQWADTILFPTAMAYNFAPAGAAEVFKDEDAAALKAFAEDRSKMRGGAPRMPAADATGAYRSYLRRIASMLDGQPFVLGEQPCLADFALYHPLWFTRHVTPVMSGVLLATPAVLAWMDRVKALAQPAARSLDAAGALQLARESTPAPLHPAGAADAAPLHGDAFQDEHKLPLGSRVTITAESFGTEATEGELLAATRMHYTLRRTDPRCGTVHVHFPRIGYILRAASSP